MSRSRSFTTTMEAEPIEGLFCEVGCNFDSDGYHEELCILAIYLPSGDLLRLPEPVPICHQAIGEEMEELRRETLADWAAEDAVDAEDSKWDSFDRWGR